MEAEMCMTYKIKQVLVFFLLCVYETESDSLQKKN